MDSLMQAAMTRGQRSREGGMAPSAVYGLKVPAGDIMVPANTSLPISFRITMAAIDPSASIDSSNSSDSPKPRATLKIVKEKSDMEDLMDDYYDESDDDDDEDDDDDDDENDEKLQKLLKSAKDMGDEMDVDEDEDDYEDGEGGTNEILTRINGAKASKHNGAEKSNLDRKGGKTSVNGGTRKAKVNLANGVNGIKEKKSSENGLVTNEPEELLEDVSDEDEDEDDDDSAYGLEEFVLCTLDPEKNYQHPLDIYIGNIDEADQVYFKVSGTHDVYLTGNYLEHEGARNYDELMDMEDEDEEDDISEDDMDDEDEEDELDSLQDPRITEIHSAEASPEPSKANNQKGKNKRPAEDVEDKSPSLDNMISKSLKPESGGEQKLSKKQLKKMKNNAGNPVAAGAREDQMDVKEVQKAKGDINGKGEKGDKGDKKVQFAKNLEQGPTGSPQADPKATSKKDDKSKPSLGVKVIQGVKIDDKKLGDGPTAKKGDKVAMRYIGKLEDGKVFDANKKGKPFTFKLGSGEVIKGWDIGVAGMSRGGERRISIPANLGYGSKGVPGIPANSNLVFDIKMISIN